MLIQNYDVLVNKLYKSAGDCVHNELVPYHSFQYPCFLYTSTQCSSFGNTEKST